jgi:hypothetical protein
MTQMIEKPFFWVENVDGPGVQLIWDLDSGDVKTPVTPTMAEVLPKGLARYGDELRAQLGSVVSVKITHEEGGASGQWHTQEMAVRYSKSVFPVFISITFDEGGRLAGITVDPSAGAITDVELEDAFRSLPGSWSVTALAPGHPELAFRYRADEAQGVASQFKVLLLAKACAEVTAGRMTLSDRLTMTNALRGVPSCTLCDFDGGLQPTLRDVLHLLVSVSDNTAADLLREHFGWASVNHFAETIGVEHPPPLISTQGLFALECSAGPLSSVKPMDRGRYLASLSTEERVQAADEAAKEAFADGPDAMTSRCWKGQTDARVATAIAEVMDWPMRTSELAGLYANALQGQLVDEKTSECFLDFLSQGGSGSLPLDEHFVKGGAKNGIEADIRSLGLEYQTDRGPIAISISAAHIPSTDTDRAFAELNNAGKVLALYLYRQLPETK